MLKTIVDRIGYLEVYKHLKDKYDMAHDVILRHLHVLYEWRGLTPTESVLTIQLERVEDGLDGQMYWSVVGVEDNNCKTFAMEFTRWEEWLASNYVIPLGMSEDEFVAHCLYEATFSGFTQEEIQGVFDEICQNVDDMISSLDFYDKPIDIQSAIR